MNKLKAKVGQVVHTCTSAYDKVRFSRNRPEFEPALTFPDAVSQFATRNQLYAYMHHYFSRHLPPALRAHRKYFSTRGRGFGEEAFHSMWYLLLKEFRPKKYLEIGVFRGQVISLWALIGKIESIETDIRCISPFAAVGDRVSNYVSIDFLDDVTQNFRHFDLAEPQCIKALSTDERAVSYMQREKFDCIYIDGSHDYEVVLCDYRNSVAALNTGGLLVMDDSSLHTDFVPPAFSFAGHPGPSKVARECADRELTFVAGVGHQNIYRKP